MRESICTKIGSLAAFVIAILLTVGCSDDDSSTGPRSTDFPARTLAVSPTSTGTTAASQPFGATIDSPGVMLRIEGDTGTEFSGICATGAEDSVLVGQVPKTYHFDLRNESLSCRIKKQSPGAGSLQTVLLAGDNTRSIQQTNSQESIINVSYSGG